MLGSGAWLCQGQLERCSDVLGPVVAAGARERNREESEACLYALQPHKTVNKRVSQLR